MKGSIGTSTGLLKMTKIQKRQYRKAVNKRKRQIEQIPSALKIVKDRSIFDGPVAVNPKAQ